MKQTAVEWLEKQFVKLESTIGVHGVMYEFIEQAKEMEREQIMNSWAKGVTSEGNMTSEQYYNETFKK